LKHITFCAQYKYHVQERLANAKVSGLQQCVYMKAPIAKKSTANQLKEHIEKYIQWVTTLSLTIRVYLHSFSCCCLRNLRNPEKFSEKN